MSQTSEHPPAARPPGERAGTVRGPAAAAPAGPAWPRLVGLLVVVAAVVVLAVASGSLAAVAFVFALVACVTLHEAGHFVTAKWSGMKVSEFFFGFGPRLWSFRRGETEYGVKALPFGGYVKILGMSNLEKDVDPADEARTYRQQSFPRRLAVAVAGICTHFVIAFLLLVVMWSAVGLPTASLTVGSISRLKSGPSPAQDAGFQPGDRIVSVDGHAVKKWDELPPYIRARPGKPITFVVERNGQPVTLVATPAPANPDGEQTGFIGIGARLDADKVNPVVGAGRAVKDIGRLTVASVKALGSFFSPSSLTDYGNQLTGSSNADNQSRPVSVVGVVRIADQAAQQGLFDFLSILVLLNIFVAVLNAVPLLPLDGGHIAIATYERIRSRKGKRYHADVQKMLPVTAAVVVLLIALGVTSLWLDIVHPVGNPFQ